MESVATHCRCFSYK